MRSFVEVVKRTTHVIRVLLDDVNTRVRLPSSPYTQVASCRLIQPCVESKESVNKGVKVSVVVLDNKKCTLSIQERQCFHITLCGNHIDDALPVRDINAPFDQPSL